MRKHVFILIGFIAILFVLSGCGGRRECSADTDCNRGACFVSTCSSGQCVHNAVADCCGNAKCEATSGENKCSCAADCGACAGGTADGLVYKCTEENMCVATEDLSVKQSRQETPVLDIIDPGATAKDKPKVTGKIYLTYEYPTPFNVNKDLFQVTFRREGLPEGATSFTVEKVRVVYKNIKKDPKGKVLETTAEILGETDVNQILHDDRMKSKNEIQLNKVRVDPDIIPVDIEAFYKYNIEESGKIREVKGQITYTVDIKLIKPQPPTSCGECETRACATAKCDETTKFFCEYTYKGACCGNRICELNENKCGCPEDCGECYASHGKWITDQCFNNKCVGKVTDPGLIQPIILSDTRILTDKVGGGSGDAVKTIGEYTFYTPFDINKDRFNVEFKQQFIHSDVKDFKIRRIELLAGNQLLAKHETEVKLYREGDRYTVNMKPIVSLKKNEEKEFDLSVQVFYRYTVEAQGSSSQSTVVDKQYKYPIGKVTFINPEVSSY